MDPVELPEARVTEMVFGVAAYLRRERELYFRASEPLSTGWRAAVQDYFSAALLDRIKTIILQGARIPPPPFYAEAMAFSSGNFPDFVHLASITYLDVIVFHDEITLRTLSTVWSTPRKWSSSDSNRYTELYVGGFVKFRSWIAIPLEAQAYQLDTRFAMSPSASFSAEDEVRAWVGQSQY
jgi:hypothetical protein